MAIFTVELADGREVEVEANSPQEAARAAHTYQVSNPANGRRTPVQEATGAMATFNRGIPFATDVTGAYHGLMRGGGEALRQTFDATIGTPGARLDPGAIGRAAREGYQSGVQHSQEASQDFRQRRPITASYLEGTGMAASVAPTLAIDAATGGAAAPFLAARTPALTQAPGLFTRMGQAGSVGSVYGYGYGAGGQDQAGRPLQDRMNAGNEGAGFGAVTGAVLPAGIAAARQGAERLQPAWRSLVRGAERIPVPDPNSVGVMGRPMRQTPQTPRRQPPQRPQIPAPVINYVERNARRERLTPDQLQAEFANARRNPQGQVLNDVLGDNGVRQLRPIVQAPGETSRRAGEVLAERNAAQSDHIMNSLRQNLRVGQSRQAAIRSLRGERERVSVEGYRPTLSQQLSSQQARNLEQAYGVFRGDPVFDDAVVRAQRVFERHRRLGYVTGTVDENPARFAHYLKLGLDDAITAAPIGSRGLQPTEMADVAEMGRRIVRAIDDNVPGYREARAQWGSLRAGEDALEEGAKFLEAPSDEVAARVAEMTPFELEHARIGMAHEISQIVGLGGREVGTSNVANSRILNSPEGRRRIAAVFMPTRRAGQTPEQYNEAVREAGERAARFIETVSTQNRLMRNATGWNGGSSSYANFAHGDDNAAAAAAEGFVDVVRGDVSRAVNRGARQVGNLVFNNAIERQNNIVGEAALRRIDDNEAKAFTDELVRILRERERARLTDAATGRVSSATAGSQQGRRE